METFWSFLILARWETEKDIKIKIYQIDSILMNLFIIHSVLCDSIKIGCLVNDDLFSLDFTLYLLDFKSP